MATRRQFIQHAAAMAVVTSAPPCRSAVRSMVLRDETMLRLGGVGSPFGMTWMADDRQLLAVVEGGIGWPGVQYDRSFASAMFSVRGAPGSALLEVAPAYPFLDLKSFYREKGLPPYWGGPTLAIGERIYQYMATFSASVQVIDGIFTSGGAPTGVKLIYSEDNGCTWRNQDGSTPVRHEAGKDQSLQNMIFWNEPDGVFGYPALLQMGKAYRDNRDGYVYGYSTSKREGRQQLFMFRVKKEKILERRAYEFCAERRADGSAAWVRDVGARGAVAVFSQDWECFSVAYNQPLGLYMMACSHLKWLDQNATSCESTASGLGFWIASSPWGPWTQVFEKSPWLPGHASACAARPIIAPGWIAADGKSFWLVWADMYQGVGFDIASLEKAFFATNDAEKTERLMTSYRDFLPQYRFNAQRVDLIEA